MARPKERYTMGLVSLEFPTQVRKTHDMPLTPVLPVPPSLAVEAKITRPKVKIPEPQRHSGY